jgi:HEAT repeat protein
MADETNEGNTNRYIKKWVPKPNVSSRQIQSKEGTEILSSVNGIKNSVLQKQIKNAFRSCIPEIRGIGKQMIIKYYSENGNRDTEFIRALAISVENDKIFNVSYQALIELRKMLLNQDIKDPAVYTQVIDTISKALIENESHFMRELAADTLGEVGDAKAIEHLTKALKDPEYSVKIFAEYKLAKLKARLFSSPVPVDVEYLKNSGKVDNLVKILLNGNEFARVRLDAAQALGTIHEPQSTIGLIFALRNTNFAIRKQAIASLDRLLDPQSVDALVDAIRDNKSDLRVEAICALTNVVVANKIHDIKVLEVLLWVVENTYDKDEMKKVSIRELTAANYAIHALGKIGDTRAEIALSKMIADDRAAEGVWSHRNLNSTIRAALDAIRVVQLPNALDSSQERRWVSKESQAYAAKCIEKSKILAGLCRFEKALQCIDAALDNEPNISLVWEAKGDVLLELQRNAEANACYLISQKMKITTHLFA